MGATFAKQSHGGFLSKSETMGSTYQTNVELSFSKCERLCLAKVAPVFIHIVMIGSPRCFQFA